MLADSLPTDSELGKEVRVLIDKSFDRFMAKNMILKKKEI